MSIRRGIAAVALFALAAGALTGCFIQADGDANARATAQLLAEEFADEVNGLQANREGEYLAANLPAAPSDPGRIQVTAEPMAWSGVSNVAPGAVVEVRYTVHLDRGQSSGFNEGTPAGDAVRCYRVTVLYNFSELEEIDCTTDPAPSPPTPAPLLVLPEDARERLALAIATSTPETLAADARAAFPEEHFLIDTEAADGMLIVAMRATDNSDCIVAIRQPDGTVVPGAFDPIWAQPGETGCSTHLITHPPL